MKLFGKKNNTKDKVEHSLDSAFNEHILRHFEDESIVNDIPDELSVPVQTTERVVSNTLDLDDAAGAPVLLGISSVIGKRDYQQDAVAVSDNTPRETFRNGKFMAVLCDGMGGMNGGEKASALCVEQTLAKFAQNQLPYPEFYTKAIVDIDAQVANLKDENGNFLGGGSTFISVIIDDDKLYWGSVGDSHIYIIRDPQIVLANTEHNYMMELLEKVKRGEITLEQANADREKDALISYMGMGCVTLMDVIGKPFELHEGDYILLCSDGLYRSASDSEIYDIVVSEKHNMQRTADRLIDCAMSKNNPYQDNTSVIVIKYQ